MNPQQLAFAWCKMRTVFNEPVNHHMLAAILYENQNYWNVCLAVAERLVNEWRASGHKDTPPANPNEQTPQELAFAWCKERQIADEPLARERLASVLYEHCRYWGTCLMLAADLVKEWHASEHEAIRNNPDRPTPQPPAEMLAAIQSYYAGEVMA